MFFHSKKLFSIGQFAKLHNINKKTLMWYDETGLLKPAIIKDNGYRYYTYQQSSLLETLLMLRELNMSIPEIKKFIEKRSALSLKSLLEDKRNELEETISHLEAVKAVLNEKIGAMAEVCKLDISEIEIIEKSEPHYFITIPTSQDTPLEKEIELVVEETKKYHLHRLHDASYGAMLPAENLYKGDFSNYSALYMELPFPAHPVNLHVQPKGTYLRAFSQGDWNRLPNCYAEILAYAKSHNLQLSGFAYERGINEAVIDTMDDYITQIEVQVHKKP